MARQNEATQKEILSAIEKTSTMWKALQKEQLIKNNVICPLCNLIKTVYRLSFHKGSARGACMLCPVKHAGYFHICVGIQHVYSTPDMTDEEMKSLRKTVVNNLEELKDKISNKEHYGKYVDYVTNTRRSLILGKQTGTIRKSVRTEKSKPRRIFKVNKDS